MSLFKRAMRRLVEADFRLDITPTQVTILKKIRDIRAGGKDVVVIGDLGVSPEAMGELGRLGLVDYNLATGYTLTNLAKKAA